jgi:hypothetical protein
VLALSRGYPTLEVVHGGFPLYGFNVDDRSGDNSLVLAQTIRRENVL